MKKKHYPFRLIFILLFLMVITGCGGQEEELWVYRPMISIGDDLFGDTGHTRQKLSDQWELVGIIEQEVSQTEPMVTGEPYYIANELPVGTEIYGSPDNPGHLYAKYNQTYIRYELMEE